METPGSGLHKVHEKEEDEATCPYVTMEEGVAATKTSKSTARPDQHLATVGGNTIEMTEKMKTPADDIAAGEDATETTSVPDLDIAGLAKNENRNAPSSWTPANLGENAGDQPSCCARFCKAVDMCLAYTVLFAVILFPAICVLVETIFFWRLSAARGKGMECDLQSRLDGFYWFIGISVLLRGVGCIVAPFAHLEERKLSLPERMVVFAIFLAFLFVGCVAVIWIPDDATCPETAPDYFQAARYFLYLKLWEPAVALFVGCVYGYYDTRYNFGRLPRRY